MKRHKPKFIELRYRDAAAGKWRHVLLAVGDTLEITAGVKGENEVGTVECTTTVTLTRTG